MNELNLKPLLLLTDWFNTGKDGNRGMKGLGDDPESLKGFSEQIDLLNEMAAQYGTKRGNKESDAKIKQHIHNLIEMNIPIHPEIARRLFNRKIGKPKIGERIIVERSCTDAIIRTIFQKAKSLFKEKKLDEVDYYIGKCLNYDVLNKRPAYRQSALYKDTSREIGYLVDWLMDGWADAPIGKLSLPRKEEVGDSLNSLKLMYMSQEIAGARMYFVKYLCPIDEGKNAVR